MNKTTTQTFDVLTILHNCQYMYRMTYIKTFSSETVYTEKKCNHIGLQNFCSNAYFNDIKFKAFMHRTSKMNVAPSYEFLVLFYSKWRRYFYLSFHDLCDLNFSKIKLWYLSDLELLIVKIPELSDCWFLDKDVITLQMGSNYSTENKISYMVTF